MILIIHGHPVYIISWGTRPLFYIQSMITTWLILNTLYIIWLENTTFYWYIMFKLCAVEFVKEVNASPTPPPMILLIALWFNWYTQKYKSKKFTTNYVSTFAYLFLPDPLDHMKNRARKAFNGIIGDSPLRELAMQFGQTLYFDAIRNRCPDRNYNICITGDPGTGKTTGALAIAGNCLNCFLFLPIFYIEGT